MQNYIDGLEETNFELADEVKDAIKEKRAALRSNRRLKKIASSRLQQWHKERALRREAQDEIAHQSKIAEQTKEIMVRYKAMVESSDANRRRMKKEWETEAAARRRGGRRRWPVWVVQMVCELLTNGTPPSAVPGNIVIMYETLYGKGLDEPPPSVSSVRECRLIVQTIGETIAAIKLASSADWPQLWTDATTRRQLPFTALIIGLWGNGKDDEIDPMVVSSCIFMEDETAETGADGILNKVSHYLIHALSFIQALISIYDHAYQINSLKVKLTRLREIMHEIAPEKVHLIPSPDEIDTTKLGKSGLVITDTCSTAQKLRRILVSAIEGSLDFDCMNHLRCVWINGVEKALTSHLNCLLRASLDEIDPRLRVTASINAVIRAVDKEFSLSANYPKGHGELFLEWMRENHSGELLLHVERAAGSRQDLSTEGCMAIVMNYPYYLEFLDEHLRKKEKTREISILQQNLFVALSSEEMLALARLMSILHLSVCIPMRWLAGKTHELKRYNWGPMSMGRAIDTLEHKMEQISKNPRLIEDESFMMNIFLEYADELPPLKEYFNLLYDKKQMRVVARKDGTKVVHFARIRQTLFSPVRKSDRDTKPRVMELTKIAADALLAELRDEKKATHKYLSRFGQKYSWKHCPEANKVALLGRKATNDECESALGGTTSQIQRYSRINIPAAAAISDAKRNAFFHRNTGAKSDKKKRGLFHEFDEDVRHAIVLMAMRDAPATRSLNTEALKKQATARRMKEEVAKQKNMKKATDEYIEATCLINMYNSDKCMKDDPKNLTKMLKTLGSNTAKLNAIKTNIDIRLKGFRWEWCRTAFSQNGVKFTVQHLAKRLRWIVSEEKRRKLDIPISPTPNVTRRKDVGIVGKQIDFVRTLDEKYLSGESEFKQKAEAIRQQKEESGDWNIYKRMQPFTKPELEDLLDRRIDVNFKLNVAGEPVLKWCQGEVIEVYSDRAKPTVRVLWDPTPDIEGSEETSESDQILLPGKWNRDVDGAWRMDVDIAIGDEDDADDEFEHNEVELMDDSSDSEEEEEGDDGY